MRRSKHISAIVIIAIVAAIGLVFLTYTQKSEAFIWGGQFSSVIPCWNAVTWVRVGAPLGGDFIWTPGVTRTFDYGRPTHAGQYGLGLAAPPYFCIVSPFPVIVIPGIIMTMLGTSGSSSGYSAPVFPEVQETTIGIDPCEGRIAPTTVGPDPCPSLFPD
ncbi:hypothetical protein COB52_02155 [Candidatus Kaiserbacteria bacterium]|nr:MAG: hypothetical protein COB52_02155 [Candidatus Kaiserbacteria bacterium]